MTTKFSWLSLLSLVGVSALTAVIPALQNVVVAHPTVTAVLAGVWGVLGHLLTPPSGTPAAK